MCLSVLMTLRQVFSIILSSLYFHHPLTAWGCIGLTLVFSAILADTYRRYSTSSTGAGRNKGGGDGRSQ